MRWVPAAKRLPHVPKQMRDDEDPIEVLVTMRRVPFVGTPNEKPRFETIKAWFYGKTKEDNGNVLEPVFEDENGSVLPLTGDRCIVAWSYWPEPYRGAEE